MLPFVTEFPIRTFSNKAAFLAEVFAWLRGMRSSTILSAASEHELDGENVHFSTEAGEELRMRELTRGSDWGAMGFRHDIPDDQGRIWRTEAVLNRGNANADQDFIRFRTQCFATQPGAFVQSPKKPFLIKSLLRSRWGGVDGKVDVCDEPFWLEERDDDLELADLIISGGASKFLPIIYISAKAAKQWLFTEDDIQKLAYDLGGVAHVMVEPSRNFSFQLRDRSDGQNVYGGTVGLALPYRGFIRRFFLGRQFENVSELLDGIRGAAVRIKAHMPSTGWDWTDFQENVLRSQRAVLRGSLTQIDADQLFDDFTKQLDDLQEENRRLKDQINSQITTGVVEEQSGLATDGLLQSIGKEIYPGEVVDRIKLAVQTAISVAEANGIDERSVAIWTQIGQRVPRSPALDELLLDLSRATKDPKRMADEVAGLLQRHGYRDKSDNKHIRLEPQTGFAGLQNITLSKTPGDVRGLMNARKQIERTLGIGKLPCNPRDEK